MQIIYNILINKIFPIRYMYEISVTQYHIYVNDDDVIRPM